MTTLSSTLDGQSTITNIADLDNVIAQANAETTAGTYVINLGANATIALSQALTEISLQSGVTLDIVGNGATINAEVSQRGLFVYSGVVSISDLTIENAAAVGANGTNAAAGGGTDSQHDVYYGGGGGGGAAGL